MREKSPAKRFFATENRRVVFVLRGMMEWIFCRSTHAETGMNLAL
jgi:hypothetical protein